MRSHGARILRDLKALQAAEPDILTVVDETEKYPTFYVTIKGPVDSLYAGGTFTLCCILPEEFPMKSPSVAFKTKIWHPNIEHRSGSICLDVLRDAWSPLISLRDIFETYIPQLLLYPEPTDPFNIVAATHLQKNTEEYNDYVRAHTLRYAVAKDKDKDSGASSVSSSV